VESFKSGGKSQQVDAKGFLVEFGEWDRGFAEGMASQVGIMGGLSERHWKVIDFIRDEYNETGECPLVFTTCRATGLSMRDFKDLFPTGYVRGACRLAGITYRDRFLDFFGETDGPKRKRLPQQTHTRLRDKVYRVDALGFLVDPAEWDEEFAINKAREMKIPGGLSAKHYEVIEFLRRGFEKTGTVPTVIECCEIMGLELEDLERLFPDGYDREAVKIAGLCVL
jgi:TusE/DsrC/DsvC family sulfur relay protein